MNPRLWQSWWEAIRWPSLVFVALAVVFACSDADISIARTWFFDASQGRWIGAHNWWVETFVHTGGRWAIRAIVLASLCVWAAGFRLTRLHRLRHCAGYFAVASTLSIGVVGLLKMLTNVDCPWDLVPFGGQFPVVNLFADRPDALRAGHCFPAAHASSGYALIALYFAARERNAALARAGLVLGMVSGTVFGLAQQSRGAHFVSHDVWSAFLVWVTAASVYVFGFGAQLHAARVSGVNDGAVGERCARLGGIRECERVQGELRPAEDLGRNPGSRCKCRRRARARLNESCETRACVASSRSPASAACRRSTPPRCRIAV